jgi:DNA-binding CsgD family transcriptional regulator
MVDPSEGPNGPVSGERALVLAVLVDAIQCLTGKIGSIRHRDRHIAEARTWVEDRDTSWPFSFDNVCDLLGLEAAGLRRRLLNMAAEVPPAECTATSRRPARSRMLEEQVTQMIREGHPLRAVAERFGISVPQVSTLSGRLATQLRAERDLEILRLRREGWSYATIAQRYRLSRIRIARICGRAGAGRMARNGTHD